MLTTTTTTTTRTMRKRPTAVWEAQSLDQQLCFACDDGILVFGLSCVVSDKKQEDESIENHA